MYRKGTNAVLPCITTPLYLVNKFFRPNLKSRRSGRNETQLVCVQNREVEIKLKKKLLRFDDVTKRKFKFLGDFHNPIVVAFVDIYWKLQKHSIGLLMFTIILIFKEDFSNASLAICIT
ncbi:hypothetical protein NQ317_011738 [Molorchus minor]|uniref:Uncharacterized protein n=1 Tax=Molorchus minor TaxID=1323400 RepID=A0ABQ9JAE6_9CUCU|nr:hypothetical protein NQ317_011738 [Molorchus minor]